MKKITVLLLSFIVTLSACFAEDEPISKIIKCENSSNVCIVRNKKLYYGLADKESKLVVPMEYTNIKLIPNEENYLLEKKSKTGEFLYGIANQKGEITVPPVYHSIVKTEIAGKYKFQPNWDFKYGLLDGKTGNIDIEPVYNYFYRLKNGDYSVEKNFKEGIISSDFKVIIPAEYYKVYAMTGDKYYTLHKEVNFINEEGLPDSKFIYGIADRTGKLVVPLECSWVEHGIASHNYRVTKDGKTYVFDSNTGTFNLKG